MTKYSSSREIIDSRLQGLNIVADDKVFMSEVLQKDQYTRPLPVGQSDRDKKTWSDIHIKCNLPISGVDNAEFTKRLEEAIASFKITDTHQSELYFCYYKPLQHTIAHRIEIKKSVAEDSVKLERFLRSIKRQIVFPEIREPYPQFLADIVAKNIHFGMEAVNQAIFDNPVLSNEKYFELMLPYRT